MGLTERHWFEDEEPELTERQLEDIVYENKKAYDNGYLKGYHDAVMKYPEIVRCKNCENWIPGHITDQDDFIPPKCGKYQQMVGHYADDFCSLAEKQEGR